MKPYPPFDPSKFDFEEQRRRMVENLKRRGIRNPRILEAFQEVPREDFVPDRERMHAYEDRPLSLGFGQTISQPYIVAIMLEALNLSGQEKVLEIGTGSGYQTALLAELSREVYTVDLIPELVQQARTRLERLGYRVHFRIGDGGEGWPKHAPYDRVIVSAAMPKIPPPLLNQLRDGGILVGPVGDMSEQDLIRVQKKGNRWRQENLGPCVFVPLRGRWGFDNPLNNL